MGKSHVTLLKPVTIPRLELTGAVVSSKISCILRKELEYAQMKEVCWTDSKTVLGYINNDARRFMCSLAIVSRKYVSGHPLTSGATWEQNPILRISLLAVLVPKS